MFFFVRLPVAERAWASQGSAGVSGVRRPFCFRVGSFPLGCLCFSVRWHPWACRTTPTGNPGAESRQSDVERCDVPPACVRAAAFGAGRRGDPVMCGCSQLGCLCWRLRFSTTTTDSTWSARRPYPRKRAWRSILPSNMGKVR